MAILLDESIIADPGALAAGRLRFLAGLGEFEARQKVRCLEIFVDAPSNLPDELSSLRIVLWFRFQARPRLLDPGSSAGAADVVLEGYLVACSGDRLSILVETE